MNVNLLHLRSFYAVAKERSVSKAARRLNISQPTLSKQVKALEERHKIKLLEGRRPPLSLTPAGHALMEKADVLFGTANEIDAILGAAAIDSDRLLRVGTDSPPYAAAFLAALTARVPQLHFRVTIANASQTASLLTSAQIDLGIICEPIIQSDYSYVPLYVDRLVAIVPVAWTVSDPVPLSYIVEQPLLVREPTSRTLAAVKRLFAEAELVPQRIVELHTREMIREAVAQGLGISLMFERECPPDLRIRVLPIDSTSMALYAKGYLAVRSEHQRIPLIRAALDVGREMLGSNVTEANVTEARR
ncbi:LysR family transcriptional regulator [Bosea sp. TND4EK4]|uniref:LysR family transcriptional regulator n=1 Tax=Bosea sp. TND4EK4 TaxID=1907408 RepID=UPI000955D3FC|nr:LysR family transcriptional regulator [Bosea sp. TND4EK4]SIR03530.1 transcriptional regulator, LysR family [Bosea sp. TND4EK4]